MKVFEIDVSGEDLLNGDYSICVALNEGEIIKGFKIDKKNSQILNSRYGQGVYNRYRKSQRGKANLKIRIYCVVIYYLFRNLDLDSSISLNVCRDFNGRKEDIKLQLTDLLERKLGLEVGGKIFFSKLESNSKAHKYAYLMKKDSSNKLNIYVKIKLEEIERWLKK